jgi:hypothetical protein
VCAEGKHGIRDFYERVKQLEAASRVFRVFSRFFPRSEEVEGVGGKMKSAGGDGARGLITISEFINVLTCQK